MYILIAGAGTVGSYIADLLLKKGHEVAIIDSNSKILDRINDSLDILCFTGEATDREIMKRAGIHKTDLFIAATNIDEVNLTACAIAKKLGAAKNLARVRDDRYYRNREEILETFNLEMIFSPENLTATEIVNLIKTPGADMVENFARGLAQVRTIRMHDDSPVISKKLSEASFPKGAIIAAIKRDNVFIIPSGQDKLLEDDVLYMVGKPEALNEVEHKLSAAKQKPVKNIFIFGDSDVVPKLARKLESEKYDVKIFVSNPENALEYSDQLKKTVIIQAASTDISVFKEERISHCDVFVGASKEADKNIIAVTLARNLGAKSIMVLVDNMDYMRVAEQLDINHILSARILTANSILRYIMHGNVKSVAVLEEGMAEMVEMAVSRKSPIAGKQISKAGLPREAIVATLVRGEEVIVPRGQDEILEGDVAIVFTHPKNMNMIQKLFSG